MIKNKFICCIFCLIFTFVSLQACSLQTKNQEDRAKDLVKINGETVDKSLYLKKVTSNTEDDGNKNANESEIIQLEKKDFYKEQKLLNASPYYPRMQYITNEIDKGEVVLKEFLVDNYQRITKGTPIARVHVLYDHTITDELQVNLEREQENFKNAKDKYKKQIESYEKKLSSKLLATDRIYTKLSYDDCINDWTSTEKAFQERIAKLQKDIDKYKELDDFTEIKSNVDGFIVWKSDALSLGDIIKKDDRIIAVSTGSKATLVIDDPYLDLSYGLNVDVIVTSSLDKHETTYKGKVISADHKTLSYNVKDNRAYIEIDAGEEILPNSYFSVNYVTEEVKDVVIVPLNYVWRDYNTYEFYVLAVDDKGNKNKVYFEPGTYTVDYMWVQRGLEEGMKVYKSAGDLDLGF